MSGAIIAITEDSERIPITWRVINATKVYPKGSSAFAADISV